MPQPKSTDPVAVVTGSAGFLGSHLTDRLLAEGFSVVGIDNLITGNVANIEHLASNERFEFIKHDVTKFIYLPGPGRCCLPLRFACQPDRLSEFPDSDVEGRCIGDAQRFGAGQGEGGQVLARVDFGSLRRSLGASANRRLLGQREPDRTARRLRRSQALCRGDDDGLSPFPRRRYQDRAHFQHPTALGCGWKTAEWCRRSLVRPCGGRI